jgi:leishmanolysin-like peptidase
MYLYVTAVQDATCNGGAAGWALPCLFDLSTNRPIMGSANMCPYALLSSDTDQMVSVMVHEVRAYWSSERVNCGLLVG